MTADQVAARIEELIIAARESGLSDATIADVLQDAADALREGELS